MYEHLHQSRRYWERQLERALAHPAYDPPGVESVVSSPRHVKIAMLADIVAHMPPDS